MDHYPEKPERPVAALWRACALLEATGTVPLRAPDAVALLAYRAWLEAPRETGGTPAARDMTPGEIRLPDHWNPQPERWRRSACEPGAEAASMLRLLSFGHTLR
jgi:hypothetical protein